MTGRLRCQGADDGDEQGDDVSDMQAAGRDGISTPAVVPGWIPLQPNTVIAAASALCGAAEMYRSHGNEDQADCCDELARRLARRLPPGIGPVMT